MKKCQYCNKEFAPTNNRQKYCSGPHFRTCPVCGDEYEEKDNWQLQFPPHACSYKCRGVLQSRTKATKPKKQRKLIQLLEDYPQYASKFESVNSATRTKQIAELETLLQDGDIPYDFVANNDGELYDVYLRDTSTVLSLAELSTDPRHNLNKVKFAENSGYNCCMIYPWTNLPKLVNQFKPKYKINLDECELFRLNKVPANEFLATYHLQSSCRNQKLFWGIVKDDDIIQLVTFGKPRFSKSYSMELTRYCTKPGIEVDGNYMNLFYGVKALQYLQNVVGYERIEGLGEFEFEKLGFRLVKTTPPQEVWFRENEYVTASLLRAHGYNQLFGNQFSKSDSNELSMLQSGWLPIFDCGQRVYVYD